MTLTMHVLPVGRSILTKAEAGTPVLRPLLRVLAPPTKVRTELETHTDSQTGGLDLEHFLTTPQQWDAVRSQDWQSCAEWTSVTVANVGRPDDGSSYVLIASDTDDGLRSAVLVAGQYAQDKRIHYVSDPVAAANLAIEPGAVYVFRIPGLDFAANTMDELTWFSLGTVGHVRLFELNRDV